MALRPLVSIEPETGLSVSTSIKTGKRPYGFRILPLGRIFEDNNTSGGKKVPPRQGFKNLQGKAAPIRRVKKDQVKSPGWLKGGQKSKPPGQILMQHRGAFSKTAEFDVACNKFGHGALAVDEKRQQCPPAQRFKPQGTGTCKKIQHPGARNLGGQDAEDRFPGPVGGGADQIAKKVARRQQLAPPGAATDDPHGYR